MDDFSRPRREMVERILKAPLQAAFPPASEAMLSIPRHLFVEKVLWHRAYTECTLPIGRGQTLSAPSVVLGCLSALRPARRETLLEIGSGSGYVLALASRICDRVFGVEKLLDFVHGSRRILLSLGISNARIQYGDGSQGWHENAPFDCILLSAACGSVPPGLFDQLAEGGRLGAPVGEPSQQEFRVWRKSGGRIEEQDPAFTCTFVPLVSGVAHNG
jgi:protein-L-isoaspartate(D-aspartate) O-methyltransferase